MKLSIIEANLNKDRDTVIDILNQNRDYEVDTKRYEWLYLKNPFGPARVWLMKDEDHAKFIGAAAALPRSVWVKGDLIKCYILADFSIDPHYRSLGPALKLNRVSLTPVFDGEIPFAYDFPSDRMAVAHRWLKVEPIGSMLRFVRIVRLDSEIVKFLGKGYSSRMLSCLGNALLKACPPHNLNPKYSFNYEKIEPHTFNESFSDLDSVFGPGFTVCGSRNHTYLTWRYALNPLRRFYLLSLKRDGLLCAYAIITLKNKRMHVYDFFSQDKVTTKRNLLTALLRTAASEKVEGIEVALLHTNPWIPMLKKYCFILRPPASDIFVFIGKDSPFDGLVNIADNWYMTQGDRDT